MDNLQIITNSITPAKVDFNYKQIDNFIETNKEFDKYIKAKKVIK